MYLIMWWVCPGMPSFQKTLLLITPHNQLTALIFFQTGVSSFWFGSMKIFNTVDRVGVGLHGVPCLLYENEGTVEGALVLDVNKRTVTWQKWRPNYSSPLEQLKFLLRHHQLSLELIPFLQNLLQLLHGEARPVGVRQVHHQLVRSRCLLDGRQMGRQWTSRNVHANLTRT